MRMAMFPDEHPPGDLNDATTDS